VGAPSRGCSRLEILALPEQGLVGRREIEEEGQVVIIERMTIHRTARRGGAGVELGKRSADGRQSTPRCVRIACYATKKKKYWCDQRAEVSLPRAGIAVNARDHLGDRMSRGPQSGGRKCLRARFEASCRSVRSHRLDDH